MPDLYVENLDGTAGFTMSTGSSFLDNAAALTASFGASSPAPAVAAKPAVSTAAAANKTGGFSEGLGSLFAGLGKVAGAVAQGVGISLAEKVTTAVNNGRLPGSEIYVNPTSQTAGAVGTTSTNTIIPGVPNVALYVGAGVLGLGLIALLASRR